SLRSEKSVSTIGFEKGKLLNLRCACHGRCLAHNRSLSRNERSDTLDPCIKSTLSSIVQIQLPSFPFGCYTNPLLGKGEGVVDDCGGLCVLALPAQQPPPIAQGLEP